MWKSATMSRGLGVAVLGLPSIGFGDGAPSGGLGSWAAAIRGSADTATDTASARAPKPFTIALGVSLRVIWAFITGPREIGCTFAGPMRLNDPNGGPLDEIG